MNAPVLHGIQPPDWVVAVFEELDSKRYGAGLDVLAEDVEVQLGMHVWRGREAVREMLRDSSAAAESHHRVHEFWDGGSLKIARGEVTVTSSDTGQAVTVANAHFLYMDEHDRTKVRRWIGAFGPLG